MKRWNVPALLLSSISSAGKCSNEGSEIAVLIMKWF
jgi:hypothetical protein